MKARESWDIDLWFAWSHNKYQPKHNIPENFVFCKITEVKITELRRKVVLETRLRKIDAVCNREQPPVSSSGSKLDSSSMSIGCLRGYCGSAQTTEHKCWLEDAKAMKMEMDPTPGQRS